MSHLLSRLNAAYSDTELSSPGWQNPIQPDGAEDPGDRYDLLEGVQPKAVRPIMKRFPIVRVSDPPKISQYTAVSAWEPLTDSRLRTDPRCRIVLHMNWKAQTLPVLMSGLQPKNVGDRHDSVSRDQTALPQPSPHEIICCSPLAQAKRGLYTTPTFLVHGTADELIPWQQSQRMWQELTNRGVTAHLELIPGRPHICDTSVDLESPDWTAVVRGYEFLTRAVQLS